jgi:hypothetical protein
MMKKPGTQLPPVCSVSQIASAVGLSRQRFYQLIDAGVFPPPVYDINSKRPFYPQDLQQRCILVRESGIGLNGQVVLFNQPRKRGKVQDHPNPQMDQYVQVLKDLGVKTNAQKVRTAMGVIYPKGLSGRPDGIVVGELARYLIHGTIPDVQSP